LEKRGENMNIEQKRKFIINFAFICCVLLVIYFCLKYLAAWLLPFVAAFITACLLQYPISYILRKTKLTRKIVSPIVTTIVVIAAGALIFVTAHSLAKEFVGFITYLPEWYQNTVPAVMETIVWITYKPL